MQKFFALLFIAVIFCLVPPCSGQARQPDGAANPARGIAIMLGEKRIALALDDNPAVASLLEMLPLEIEFRDYNGTEKIADLPKKLAVKGAPTSCDPMAGSVAYFIPWGNIAIFYRDFRPSSNLVPLGKITSGLEYLQNMTGNFRARLIRD